MEDLILKTVLGKLHDMKQINLYVHSPNEVIANDIMYVDYNKMNHIMSLPNVAPAIKIYLRDVLSIYNQYPKLKQTKILIYIGDMRYYNYNNKMITSDQDITKFPIISKSRSTDFDNASLIMLNSNRHYGLIKDVKKYDIPYHNKKNCILWRGTTTGVLRRINGILINQRDLLASKYYSYDKSKIDVGFSYVCHQADNVEYTKYVTGQMSIKDMLAYKFLISVEGNDVASGLKWMLSSNSLVIMSKPTCISIICENLLKPWIHYVPVKEDFSDLENIYQWCLDNKEKCQKIIQNANKYMSIFTDNFMCEISAKVIKEYGDKVKIIVNSNQS